MSLPVQMQIRRNAEELRAYLSDLLEWEESFAEAETTCKETEKREELLGSAPEAAESSKPQQPPLQQQDREGQQQQQQQQQQQEEHASSDVSAPSAATSRRKFARDLNSIADYYKAWDAFDPDAETDQEGEKQRKQKPRATKPKRTPHAVARGGPSSRKPSKVSIVGVSPLVGGGGDFGPLEELRLMKEEANEAFKEGQFEAAISGYTRAIKEAEIRLKPLKRYSSCVDDCTAALQRIPLNPKTLHRRGLAWAALKETETAISDLSQALQLLKQQQQQEQQQQHQQEQQKHEQQQQRGEDASEQTHHEQKQQELAQQQQQQQQQQQEVADGVSGFSLPAAGSRLSLIRRIELEMQRLQEKAAEQKREEQQKRKAMLLLPLTTDCGRFPAEHLRPLTVVAAAAPRARQAAV
ncbi:uncharacterized protein EMH_0061780 [Eimeria mitis]|uniref:TPR domain-containing protein n=1 Tax=Eimeria mitis TaxID=44415 RepID=U6K3H6_9EIME|nr:uncharacterized protein EMH_0061780 [Eimeria mitis]CDJ30852.1 hypothetical protein EMH_0061780 [Eimeria mitis]